MIVVQEGYKGTVVTPWVSLDMVWGIQKGEGVALQAGETRVQGQENLVQSEESWMVMVCMLTTGKLFRNKKGL